MEESLTENDPGKSFVIRRRNGDSFLVHVSDCDYDRVMAAGKWCIHIHPRRSVKNPHVFRQVTLSDGRKKTQYLHQFILPGAEQVDHRSGDGLDNRRSNLRAATSAQNNHNRGATIRSSSGVRGVYWYSEIGKWVSRVTDGEGNRFYLGAFETVDDAAFAYRGAALIFHGSFARV